ncbi:MAG: hypothetical protein KA743_06210 [Geothrix sp.]|nr:hypothetical protein [Geothrix sp.]
MDRKETAFEPPMNTDEHRLKADKEKALYQKFLSVFIRQLSVFIGVHRWLKDLCLDLLNTNPSADASRAHLPAHGLRHPQATGLAGVAMITLVEEPPSQGRMDGKESAFEPPMNTDEHRLKADKEKALYQKFLSVFIRQSSVFIGVHRWLKDLCFKLLNPSFVGGHGCRSL